MPTSSFEFLLLHDRFTLQSNLGVDDLVCRMKAQLVNSRSSGRLRGQIDVSGFKICQSHRWMRSAGVVVSGLFQPLEHGTRISVVIRPHLADLIIIGVIVVLFVLDAVGEASIYKAILQWSVVGYVTIGVVFWLQAFAARRRLLRAVGAISNESGESDGE